MFYDNLKAVCDKKGVKITPIVNECGGAKGSISNWKKGASPNSDIVAKLAVRLNVSTDLLIFGKENCTAEEEKGSNIHTGNVTNSNIVGGHDNSLTLSSSISDDALEIDKIIKSFDPKKRAKFLYQIYNLAEELKKD